MKISNYQSIVLLRLKEIFPESLFNYRINFRPDFLQNIKTEKNLEVDIFLSEKRYKDSIGNKPRTYRFGIEVQGEQHFFHVPKFKNSVINIQYNDLLKQDLAKKIGFPIIEIFYSEILKSMDILEILEDRINTLPVKEQKIMARILSRVR